VKWAHEVEKRREDFMGYLRSWKGILLGGLAVFVVLWPLLYPEKFYLHVGILLLIHVIGAISLNLIMRTGLLSFIHPAFMGIGAYTSALLVMRAGLPFAIAFPLAGIVPGIVSSIVGPILLRLKGVYFVLITFVSGEVIRLVFVNNQSLFGGSNGIYDIPSARLGFFELSTKISVYYFTLAVTLIICAACISLIKSEFGRALNTINENDILAECTGVNTLKYKAFAFILGAIMVGLAGSIYAHYTRYIAPIDFTWRLGLDFIAYNVLGGIFAAWGPIIGTVILVPLPEFLRGAVQYQWILYSIIIILVIRFMPEGLASVHYTIARIKRLGKVGTAQGL
jgi:branched-chain amino acid transport system permease protein